MQTYLMKKLFIYKYVISILTFECITFVHVGPITIFKEDVNGDQTIRVGTIKGIF